MKRLLFETHRWLGIALALFMLLWFFSGLVIIYAEPTTPSRARQLAHAESLRVEPGWLSAGEAWQRSAEQRKAVAAKNSAPQAGSAESNKPRSGGGDEIVEARLLLQANEPLWLIEDGKGQRVAVSAVDGSLHLTSAQQALKIAANWAGGKAVNFIETVDKPAILRNQEALRPFHRIAVDDGAGGELLVAARTGEMVSASTRIQRGFYWAGNWVHLFRPLDQIGLAESRADVLTWTGFAAVVASLTGLIVGWLRWRPGWFGKKTYSEGRVHPYRNFWFKWHFWGGLIGGVLALTWGLSGFLNGNPWQLFSPANPGKAELTRYVGSDAHGVAQAWWPLLPEVGAAQAVELAWRRLGEETVLLAYTRDGQRLPQTITRFDDATVLAAVKRMAGNAPVANQELLHEYDSYYYLRHHRDVADRPLPVLRVELADAARTHLYIDPQDGRLLIKQDSSRRVFRWLYSALHHWDFGWLYLRPVWDVWMVTWVLLGLVLSASAVVLGWRRLGQTLRPKKHKAAQADAVADIQPSGLATENQAG